RARPLQNKGDRRDRVECSRSWTASVHRPLETQRKAWRPGRPAIRLYLLMAVKLLRNARAKARQKEAPESGPSASTTTRALDAQLPYRAYLGSESVSPNSLSLHSCFI